MTSHLAWSAKSPARQTQVFRCLSVVCVRHVSQRVSAHLSPLEHRGNPLQPSFERAGVKPRIAAACQAAFANIKQPTAIQSRLIEAVMSGDDVLLRDDTGTGKTFAIVLALLSKNRSKPSDPKAVASREPRPKITSLFIVPHAALAAQIRHWIYRMSETVKEQSLKAFPLVCQVLARDTTNPPDNQASLLRSMPPHVLVATPNGLQDVYKVDPEVLQLKTLSTVVLDEADEMIAAVPALKDKKKMEIIRKRIEKHPNPTLQILDVIYASRIKANLDPNQAGGEKRHRSDPQLIISSATLRTHLKRHLYGEKGLLRRGKLQKIFGVGFADKEGEEYPEVDGAASPGEGNFGQGRNTHCALLVSADGSIRNIPSAVASSAPQENTQTDRDDPDSFFDSFQEVEVEASALINNRQPSPFNPNVLEAIATCFALEVSTAALLVLPSSAPVKSAVAELQELGIDAQPLDLTKAQDGVVVGDRKTRMGSSAEPTMVVTTAANIRGMDLPELSHVFLIAHQGLKHDEYLHISGRVGRFGKRGKMVCVLEESKETGLLRVDRLERIYRKLDVKPTRLEPFD